MNVQVVVNLDQSEKHCKKKWTERGSLDQNMYRYCMGRQSEGWDKLQTLVSDNQAIAEIDQIVSHAIQKWTERDEIDYRMVPVTVNSKVEGWLNIKYALDHGEVSQDVADKCIKTRVTSAEPHWDRAWTCIENQ